MSGPLTIVVDADVTNATAKIGQFTYTVKKEFGNLQKAVNSTTKSFAYNTKQMEGSVANVGKSSRIALTNLSLVLQDLPYGFIGIQNNLPFLTQSFGQLSTAAGGTTNALKAMGAGLLGPAGIFLAISTVTAAVTFAIQKYGSLGAAYDALINKTGQLTENQREIANQVAEESTKVITLFGLYNTLSGSREQQINIIKKLKEISPEYFGQLDAEKTKIDQLKQSIDKYIDSFVGKIFVENQQKAVNELLAKYAERITTVINEQVKVEKQNKKNQEGAKAFIKTLEEIEKTRERAPGDITVGLKVTPIKQTFQEALDFLKKELSKELTGVFDIGKSFKDFINIPSIFGDVKKETEKVTKKKVLSPEDLALKARKNAQKLQERADKNRERALAKELQYQEKITKETFAAADKIMALDAKEFKLGIVKLEEVTLPLKEFEDRFLQTRMLLQQSVFTPLTDIFETFFEKGTAGFKEMGKTILSTIRKLAAQIIASGIIQLVASLINPIGAVQANGPKALDLFSILGNAAKSVLSGAVNRPSFAGVQGGGMNMGGQVSVVLRGQDLIGAINRTNLQIERLG